MLILLNYHLKLFERRRYTFCQKSTRNWSFEKTAWRDCQKPFWRYVGTTVLYTDVEFERDLSFSLFTVFDVVSLSEVCIAIFPMDKNIEQRICLKFCISNGILCAESLKILQKAYGDSTLSKTRVYKWYSAFKSGRDVVEDLPRPGQPSTSLTAVNISKVKEMVTKIVIQV